MMGMLLMQINEIGLGKDKEFLLEPSKLKFYFKE
jgi:hypothetical protein